VAAKDIEMTGGVVKVVGLLVIVRHGAAVAEPTREKGGKARTRPANGYSPCQERDRSRKSYRDSLEKLWKHYYDTRNEKKLRLVEDELKQFHMMNKHLYDSRLELPSEALQPAENVSKCKRVVPGSALLQGCPPTLTKTSTGRK